MNVTVRRKEIDWLRVLAVLLLIPFHAAIIFILDPEAIMYVKDTAGSDFLNRAVSFVHLFHMPLLFALAGASTCLALQKRTGRQYLVERVKRLLVPVIFGCLALIPPMTYLTRLSLSNRVSYWEHYKGFLQIDFADLSGYSGTFTPGHLWFILFLFVFSIAGLPLFLSMQSERNRDFIKAVSRFFKHRFTLSLFVIPLSLAAIFSMLGDKNPFVYFLFFFLGFLLMTDESYLKTADRDLPYLLILLLAFEVIRQTIGHAYSEWSLLWVLYGLMINLSRLLWVLVLIGLGKRFLNRGGRALRYLSEAAYPFYILHMPLTTLAGYYVIRLDSSVALKYSLTIFLAMLATFLCYGIVRRIRILRFLFGMKPPPEYPMDVTCISGEIDQSAPAQKILRS